MKAVVIILHPSRLVRVRSQNPPNWADVPRGGRWLLTVGHVKVVTEPS
jgi:hypothetical protein